ncbi:Ulp1 peptidase [Ranunculus cassubicifolius]
MSKFWGDSSDSEDEEVVKVASKYLKKDDEKPTKSANSYVLGLPTVSRTTNEKCFRKMSTTVDQMKNAIKINDWVGLPENFDKFNKQVKKVMKVTESKQVPTMYIEVLVMLEDFSSAAMASKEPRKRRNSNALISLTQKLKNNNKQYAEMITTFRKNAESMDRVHEESD